MRGSLVRASFVVVMAEDMGESPTRGHPACHRVEAMTIARHSGPPRQRRTRNPELGLPQDWIRGWRCRGGSE